MNDHLYTFSHLSEDAKQTALSEIGAIVCIDEIEQALEDNRFNRLGEIMGDEPKMAPRTEQNRQFRDHLYSENFGD